MSPRKPLSADEAALYGKKVAAVAAENMARAQRLGLSKQERLDIREAVSNVLQEVNTSVPRRKENFPRHAVLAFIDGVVVAPFVDSPSDPLAKLLKANIPHPHETVSFLYTLQAMKLEYGSPELKAEMAECGRRMKMMLSEMQVPFTEGAGEITFKTADLMDAIQPVVEAKAGEAKLDAIQKFWVDRGPIWAEETQLSGGTAPGPGRG